MTDTHECDDPSTCMVCVQSLRPTSTPTQVEFSFTAKYPGHCGECDLEIHVGQQAAKLTNGRTVHDWCVEW